MPILMALWVTNRKVYGAVKLWHATRRAGYDIGRDQVARLMRELGIRGVQRAKTVRTTRPTDGAGRPADLVDRDFTADTPNRLWVTDLTHVATHAGTGYVCFIIDAYSRAIVGWRVASNMATSMVLDALEMARRSRGTNLEGLVAHSDAGSQYTSLRWTERLDEIGAKPSIGSVADSYDNALAEAVNGLYKTELIRGPDEPVWRTVDDVELATLGWVHWWNNERLHSYCGHGVRGPLHSPTDRPTPGWKPTNNVSTKPRANHYVKVNGVWRYVYRAVDQHGQVIDVYVSKRRNIAAATHVFETALSNHGRPAEVTTDLASPLLRVVDELIPEAAHDTEQYANNRIEWDHGRLKARLKPMRGLSTDRTASVVISGHAFVQNLRRGHYELGVEAERGCLRLAAAFDELAAVI